MLRELITESLRLELGVGLLDSLAVREQARLSQLLPSQSHASSEASTTPLRKNSPLFVTNSDCDTKRISWSFGSRPHHL